MGFMGLCLQIASAAFAAFPRLGSGGFASGYKSELVADDNSGKYAVATVAGRKVVETSQVRVHISNGQTHVGSFCCLSLSEASQG
jgi:hypothetical protein